MIFAFSVLFVVTLWHASNSHRERKAHKEENQK